MDPVVARDFEIDVERDEVLRLIGAAGRGGGSRHGDEKQRGTAPGETARWSDRAMRIGTTLTERMDRTIDACMRTAESLIHPAGVYVITAGRELPGSTMFAHLARVAFCVCTIGPALEREVSRLGDGDDLFDAFVLDAVGSVAAEATAEYMDQRIQAEAAREGLRTSCRASPGYGDWDIREQAAIFQLVPAERIDVRLKESMMMMPRKSVSFAIHIDKSPARMRSADSCRNCPRTDCPFRLLD